MKLYTVQLTVILLIQHKVKGLVHINKLIRVSELPVPPTQGGSWFSVEEGPYYPDAIGIR